MRNQGKYPEIRCVDCSYETETAIKLLNHARDVHMREIPQNTDEVFKTEDMKSGINTTTTVNEDSADSRSKFPCDICGQKYRSCILSDHVNSVHLGLKPYNCDSCAFVTGWPTNLINHKRREHSETPQTCNAIKHSRQRKTIFNVRKRPIKNPELKCLECSFTCKIASDFVDHAVDIHKKQKIGNAEDVKPPNNSEMGPLTLVQSKRRFSCNLCGFAADRNSLFLDHVNSAHLGIKQYKCDTCVYVTGYKYKLVNHKKNSRCQIKPNVNVGDSPKRARRVIKGGVTKVKVIKKCPDCDFTCEGSRKLSQHALNVHQKVLNINPNPKKAQKLRSGCSRPKDYLCDSCPYSSQLLGRVWVEPT